MKDVCLVSRQLLECARVRASLWERDYCAKINSSVAVSFGEAMTISLNGESVDAREAQTIAELVERYQLPRQSILVEHNGVAVHRHEWADRPLAEGDHIEFVRVVAGG